MILRDLWIGSDFKLPDEDARYCLVRYSQHSNECLAVRIDYDEFGVKINPHISFPFDKEVIFMPRSED
jgi:hypothetical protein